MSDTNIILAGIKWIASLIDKPGSDYHGPRDAGGFPQAHYKEAIKYPKIIFNAPDGWQPPVGIAKDQKFRVLAEIYLTEGGQLCLDSIDGKPVENQEPKEIKNDNILMETLKYRLPPTGLPSD
jgi:hypothetical protein